MNFTNQVHLEMLIALLENQVEFIIVGGYAVIFHGYVRTTGDLDIWVRPTEENKNRLLDVFGRLEFDPEGVQMIRNLDFSSVVAFHIGEEPDRIDFLSHVHGLDFNHAYQNHKFIEISAHQIPILHLDDLIVSKLLANRLQDQADVEQLRKINSRK